MKDSFQKVEYRADIDGLRAIAVLAVVLFHAFPNLLGSGFIGVDIFFVISGYLISSIIFFQLDSGSFTFVDFYRRRILRIFPPLLMLLIFVLVFGFFALLSFEFQQLGKHVAAASTFISNFVLLQESGYFDNSSETKPLLHLWSLAIEEQFYIFYPIIIWATWQRKEKALKSITIIAIVSFLVNILCLHQSTFNFYFPVARFWELMLGALTAWFCTINREILRTKVFSNSLSLLGITLLGIALLSISSKNLYPGYWALLPTLSASFIIAAGQNAFLNRFVFSLKPLVWIGKISYSFYLWHWVFFSLARIVSGANANTYFRIVFIVISIFFAWISTVFVEVPIRKRKYRWATEWKLVFLLFSLGIVGMIIYLSSGFPSRDIRVQKQVKVGDINEDAYNQFLINHFSLCTPTKLRQEATRYYGTIRCYQSKANRPIQIAIIGDSHADHLFPGIAEALKDENVVFYSKNAPPWITNPAFENIFTEVLGNQSIRKVFINAFWVQKPLSFDKAALSIKVLLEAGKQVFLFDDVPNFQFDPSRCKIVRNLRENTICSQPRGEFEKQYSGIWKTMSELKKAYPKIHLVYSAHYFCDYTVCSMSKDNKVLYRDSHHLNTLGSSFLGKHLLADYPELIR